MKREDRNRDELMALLDAQVEVLSPVIKLLSHHLVTGEMVKTEDLPAMLDKLNVVLVELRRFCRDGSGGAGEQRTDGTGAG